MNPNHVDMELSLKHPHGNSKTIGNSGLELQGEVRTQEINFNFIQSKEDNWNQECIIDRTWERDRRARKGPEESL